MEHEYNANWIPRQSRTNNGGKVIKGRSSVTVSLIVKVFLVGVVAGYLLGLVQQAVQKDTRAKIEAHRARY